MYDLPIYINDQIIAIAPLVGAALIGVGGSVLSGIGSYFSGKSNQSFSDHQMHEQFDFNHREAELQYERQRALMALANEREDYVNANRYKIEKDSLRSAGYNVNLMNPSGVSNNAPMGSASSATGSPLGASMPDFGSQFSGIMQQIASTRLVNAQAKNQEILNNRMQDEDEWLIEHSKDRAIDPDTGAVIDDLNKWKDENPNKEPEYQIGPKFRSEGSARAYERVLQQKITNTNYQTQKSVQRLQKAVADLQYQDPDVKNALVKLPQKELSKLAQEIQNLVDEHEIKVEQKGLIVTQKAIADIQKEEMELTKVSQLIANLQGDSDFGDKLLSVLGFMVAAMMRANKAY